MTNIKKNVDQLAAGCSIEETADIQEYEVYMLMSKLKKNFTWGRYDPTLGV